MCGISGIISLNGKPINNLEEKIKLMTNLLHHRGPDQQGFFINDNKNFALSNNRLSIVAPEEKIELPYSKNKKNYLSFNGEIYNFLSIKSSLVEKGCKFNSSTDTEVLYEFLKYYDNKKFNELNGMWSFAFYDNEKNNLILSRDLLGERQLYYYTDEKQLIFSSEVEPILHVNEKINEIEPSSVISSWKYNSSGTRKTLIKNIFRMRPGTNLICSNGKIKFERFQKINLEKWLNYFENSPPLPQVQKKFEELFSDELRIRIPKDVKFMTTISGGIDSTIIGIYLNKLKIFSKTFFAISGDKEEKKIDGPSELENSYHVAKKLNLNHSHISLKDSESFKDIETTAATAFDGCICSGTDNFAGLARHLKKNKNKVMIISDGADEFLGGYKVDIEAHKLDKFLAPGKPFYFLKFFTKFKIVKKIISFLLNLKKNREFEFSYDPFYTSVNHSVCSDAFMKKIFKNYSTLKYKDYGILGDEYNDLSKKLDYSQKRALSYATKTLPDMFNMRLDKASMRHSVEVRLPFQSIKITEMLIAMPSKYRFKDQRGKSFLRILIEKYLGRTISNLPKKGMGNYLWLNEDIGKDLDFKNEIRNSKFLEGEIFNKNVKKILLQKEVHPCNLWNAFCLTKTFKRLEEINKLKKIVK